MKIEDLSNIVTVGDLEKFKNELFSKLNILHSKDGHKEFYTPKEFSEITGLKYDTVLKRCREGTLPAHQPYKNGSWLIPSEEIDKIKEGAYKWTRKHTE
jgi:excisionase family DNA binding protein